MAEWMSLQCSNVEVSLAYTFHASSSGYSLFVTDLSRIFHERRTAAEIVERASKTGCNIDPGQDESQFQVLLGKLYATLEGQDGTKATILPGSANDLRLHLQAPLPPPLVSFEWAFELSELEPEHLQAHLIKPLVSTASFHRQQTQTLVNQLHEKDRVISKLLDKLESSGIDITAVFPGLAGSHASRQDRGREAIARHVKGLARFDEYDWLQQSRTSLKSSQKSSQDAIHEITLVEHMPADHSPALPLVLRKQLERVQNTETDDKRSPPETFGPYNDRLREYNASPDHRPTKAIPNDKSEHSVLPILQKSETELSKASSFQTSKADQIGNDDTTEDEDDEHDVSAGASKAAAIPHNEEETIPGLPDKDAPKKTIGLIGGRGKAAPNLDSVQFSQKPEAAPKRKAGLGVIGGKSANKISTPSPNARSSDEIGSVTNQAQSSQPLETDEEKATRRRDELKRSLEAKAKGPVKKRRF